MTSEDLETSMSHLDVLAQTEVGQLEMCGGATWQVNQQHAIDTLPILIEHNHVCEISVGCILADLLQSIALFQQRA